MHSVGWLGLAGMLAVGTGCQKVEFVSIGELEEPSFFAVVSATDDVRRLEDFPSADAALRLRLADDEQLVAIQLDDDALDATLPGINRGSGQPIELTIASPPTEAMPPYPAGPTLSLALPESATFFRMQEGQFEIGLASDDLPDALRAQLTLRVPWDPEFCRDPDAAAVRPFVNGSLPGSYEAKPILWLDERTVLVGLDDASSVQSFALYDLAAILHDNERIEERAMAEFCQAHRCLEGTESFYSWDPLSESALGDTHTRRLGAFATYDDPGSGRWVVIVRVARGQQRSDENYSYLDFFRYREGELTWTKTLGGFKGVTFGSLDIDYAGQVAVGVARRGRNTRTEEIWVFETFLDEAHRILVPPAQPEGSSPVKWTNVPSASLVLGSDLSPATLIALDQGDCAGDSCWTSWRLVELENPLFGRNGFRAFEIDVLPETGVWFGGDGGNLYRFSASDGARPARSNPPLPPRLADCVPDGLLGDIRALAVGEEYLDLGVSGCAYLVQLRKSDQCISVVNPDPSFYVNAALADGQGVRAIDRENGRVVFGGLGGQLFVFP